MPRTEAAVALPQTKAAIAHAQQTEAAVALAGPADEGTATRAATPVTVKAHMPMKTAVAHPMAA